ncbi:MAG TPA: signal recognition particle-docking protein FtsY [Ilumatobacteraceae bacterium]|nr:signal recognition particle-docking protein FtsY [Ilumatobacteraceae bacterium]
MEWIFLVLAVVVVAFGIGVLAVSRRRGRAGPPPSPPAKPPAMREATIAPPDVGVAAAPSEVDVPPQVAVEPARPASLRERMAKARSAFTGAFAGVLGRSGITDESWDELEDALLRADVGVAVTDALLDDLKTRVKAKEITEPGELLDALRADMAEQLSGGDRALNFEDGPSGSPNVWLFVGVNGVGKTTTIGKIASQQRSAGRSVLMAAGDTFRAAAAEQLGAWAERAGVELVRGDEGGDPSAVIYDGIERAAARDIDLVLADTAGRLHTKTNLMDELRKVRRVADKGVGRVTETLLVIDATTGQNGLAQAREFGEATQVTGVVLTKLDGSAKGGIVFAIETELGIPIKLVGVGETIGDLVAFEPTEFVAGLFDR